MPPSTDSLHQTLLLQLDQIELEMRQIGLWASEPPSSEALASQMPFCYDTMFFHEWLQWIFIPRMRAMILAGNRPSSACVIAPLAQHSFAEMAPETTKLEALIEHFDALAEQWIGINTKQESSRQK